METYQIEVEPNPHNTRIRRNGEPLNEVQKFVLSQSAGELAKLVLHMTPDLVQVTAEDIAVEIRCMNVHGLFDRPLGHDPYNSVDA